MLFRENDIIHSGNYEEYFLLYVDNELNDEQKQAVEQFVAAHPEVKTEFDLLLSTKLPDEEVKLDAKEFLLSDVMKPIGLEEELLLLLDNEMPETKQKHLLKEISEDKQLQLQYDLLQRTKLDNTEKIIYPDKRSLYRHTERTITLRTWLRVAAAIIVIAFLGIVYWASNNNSHNVQVPVVALKTKPSLKSPAQEKTTDKAVPKTELANQPNNLNGAQINNDVNSNKVSNGSKLASIQNKKHFNRNTNSTITNNTTNTNNNNITEITHSTFENAKSSYINQNLLTPATTSDVALKQGINKSPVTSLLPQRTTSIEAVTQSESPKNSIAINDRKGSFKGFLRKATRLIEKKTGIDPANENEELLIGAVAVKIN